MPIEPQLTPANTARVETVMNAHGFQSLTETQRYAFRDGILDPGNHLLVAETGNGKTLCAEVVAKQHLDHGDSVGYLVPSTQLVRSKYESLSHWASDEYTVTRDSQAFRRPTADVVVGTFDSFYQHAIQGYEGAQSLDLLILDDFHELYSEFRGLAMEKAIAAAQAAGTDLFAMSATIGEPQQIAEWFDADLTISPQQRSIPIREQALSLPEGTTKKRALTDFFQAHSQRAPFLVFNYAKSWCESRAEAVATAGIFADAPTTQVRQRLESCVEGPLTGRLEQLATALAAGVGFHHAALPKDVKSLVETLYNEGEITCLFATTTIAYGFDAPVQSVVIADVKRRSSDIAVYEYVQFIGRAARPGYEYDPGYAYTFTSDPETIRNRYFEPHRQLSAIDTHIDNPSEFRWLVLELVANDWTTPADLTDFLTHTLYWEQLQDTDPWGDPRPDKRTQITNKLKSATDWLCTQNFLTTQDTSPEFEPTQRGEAAVAFRFKTFVDTSLESLSQFYSWLARPDRPPLRRHTLLHRAILLADRPVGNTCSESLQEQLQQQNLPHNEYGHTAAAYHNYWVQNVPPELISTATGLDASSLQANLRPIANTYDALKPLLEASTHASIPPWFDKYGTRLSRGITAEEIPVVTQTKGIGRERVRTLRTYIDNLFEQFDSTDHLNSADSPTDFWERLLAFYHHAEGSDRSFIDFLDDHVDRIGPQTAGRLGKTLAEAIKSRSQDNTPTSIELPTTQPTDAVAQQSQSQSQLSASSSSSSSSANSESNSDTDDTTLTTLDDF